MKIQPRNIYCIGRNYAEHAKEMGYSPVASADDPVVFLKPTVSFCESGSVLRWPDSLGRVDHECELVLAVHSATEIVAVAVGIDVTARDLQAQFKKKGMPWVLAKGRDGFAPVSPWVPVGKAGPLEELKIELRVNGTVRQTGCAREMIHPIPKILAFLGSAFRLGPGDLIFTGTPEGVGPLCPNDQVEARLLTGQGEVLSRLEVSIGH